MALQIAINDKVVHEIKSVDFNVKEYREALFDYLESIKVDFSSATEIVEGIEHQIVNNIEEVLNSGKTARMSMLFNKEFEEQLQNNTENKGE